MLLLVHDNKSRIFWNLPYDWKSIAALEHAIRLKTLMKIKG